MSFNCNLGLSFREVAQKHRSHIALRYPNGETATFDQLDQLSNQVAALLTARGLGRGDVVALFHDKSSAAFAAMLACLKLGVIYTNLGPDNPWERLQKILRQCEPKLIVNSFLQLSHAGLLQEYPTTFLHLRDPVVARELEKMDALHLPTLG